MFSGMKKHFSGSSGCRHLVRQELGTFFCQQALEMFNCLRELETFALDRT
jgi:hypothetical protein